MGQYKFFWNLQDSGKEIVEANSEEEAREKFAAMLLTELRGHNQNSLIFKGKRLDFIGRENKCLDGVKVNVKTWQNQAI